MNYRIESELGPYSIQKWCEELAGKKQEELTNEQAQTLIGCKMGEDKIEKDPEMKKLLDGWNGAAILNSRVKTCHTYTVSMAVMMFFGAYIESPGIVVQYANYMQYKCWQLGIKHIDMDVFCTRICPHGFFSEETLREMWEKQKYIPKDGGALANMLDRQEFMTSIREIKSK